MRYGIVVTACLMVVLSIDSAAEEAPADGTKAMSGMSVLGNNEAPKSLVIVPWKTSEIGDGIGVANLLDGRAVPVDREVFGRELSYYELRQGSVSGSSGKTSDDS